MSLGPEDEALVNNREIAYYELRGRSYPYLYESRCRVCSSPYRRGIEMVVCANLFVHGPGSTRGVVALLPEDAGISWRSVRRHFVRRHHPHLTMIWDAHKDANPLPESVGRTVLEGLDSSFLRILGETWSETVGSGTSDNLPDVDGRFDDATLPASRP